jgi:uroporphyrinogen-III synthase
VESANGDVADLARLAASRLRPDAGRLVHVAGSVVAGDLGAALEASGFTVERAVLYEASPATALSGATVEALTGGTIDFALFYSPRTAAIFVRLIDHHGFGELMRGVTAVAISPTVAGALASLPFHECLVAAHPNQASLLNALDACVGERCNA